MPKISIIVPAHNSEDFIESSIKSIINQTINDMEIIIIDDGSTDRTSEICDELERIDDRIKVIHKKNGGASSARNLGIELSSGDYIGFVDSDDWIDECAYEYLYEIAEKYDADIVHTELTDEKESHFDQDDFRIYDKKQTLDYFFRTNGERHGHSVCGKLIRKDVFAKWKFIEGKMNEDIHACYCLAIYSKQLVVSKKKFYHYRKNNNGVTNSKFNKKKLDLIYMWEYVEKMVNTLSPEYIDHCIINKKRAYMTLLLKMYVDGYDRKDREMIQIKKMLKKHVRKYYFDLLNYNMPFSRKIAMTIAIL